MDTRTRKERRADPDRWYRICAYFDPEDGRVVNLESDSQGAVCIKGSIDNVIVIQVPDLPPKKQVEVLRGVQATLEGGGVDKPVILLPNWVEFVKLRPLDTATCKKLDRHATMKSIEKEVADRKAQRGETKH
jgi:hypothetical protein